MYFIDTMYFGFQTKTSTNKDFSNELSNSFIGFF